MQFLYEDIINDIKEKISIGYPSDDCSIDCYAYVLELDTFDPLNFSSSGVRKQFPFKGKVFFDTKSRPNFLYVREEKNGKLLKTKIKVKASYKPSLKLFSTKESMDQEYAKDKKKAIDLIDKKFASILNLKKEINEGDIL
jgi:hypothetical protein